MLCLTYIHAHKLTKFSAILRLNKLKIFVIWNGLILLINAILGKCPGITRAINVYGKQHNSYYWSPIMLIFRHKKSYLLRLHNLKSFILLIFCIMVLVFGFWFCKPVIISELSGGGSVAVAVGVSDSWQVTGDTRHVTRDIWHKTSDMWRMTFDFFFLFALLL